MLNKVVLAGLSVALAATTSFAAGNGNNRASTSVNNLSEEQKDTLLFIYQEEKVARDVYIVLGEYYSNQSVYQSIQSSEQKHMDSAQGLCETYKVDISNVDESDVGVFVVPVLQELYDTLVAQGYQSELSGLMVGEYIELTDIDDLEDAEEEMPSDVVNVYENLKAGSFSHLDAFRGAIDAYTK